MEEATGTQLAIVWDSLGPDVKLSVMREVVSMETKMMSLSFSQYAFSHSLPCANTYSWPSVTEAFTLQVMQWKVQFQLISSAKLPPN